MKKVALSLIALLAAGSFAFGQDAAKLAATVTASAEAKWAYNVETQASGFTNTQDFSLTIPLAGGDLTKAGEGTYGELTITDFKLDLTEDEATEDDATPGFDSDFSISARIVSGPFSVGIYDAPGYDYNNAATQGPLSIDAWEDESLTAASASAGGGISLGYASEMFTVTLLLSSNGNEATADAGDAVSTTVIGTGDEEVETGVNYYNAGTGVVDVAPLTANVVYVKVVDGAAASKGNEKNEYTAGVELTLVPVADMVTIEFDAFKDLYETGNVGLSGLLTLKPIAGVEVTAGFDGSKVATADLLWDSAAAVSYTLAEGATLTASTFYAPAKAFSKAGTVNAYLEGALKFVEDGATGFVPLLGASAYFKGYDLMNSSDTTLTDGVPAFVGASVDYSVAVETGTVKPYFAFDYGLLHLKGVTKDNGLIFKAGVEAKVIANTTITAEFAAGEISDDIEGYTTMFVTPYGEAGNKGVFSVAAKIAY